MSESIEVLIDGPLATIVLNRPQAMNTLDESMARGLQTHSERLAADAAIRCIVVRGAGDHFMAGGDVLRFHQWLDLSEAQRIDKTHGVLCAVHACIENLMNAPKPVIASVQGACAGFGLSLMLACDLAIVSQQATLSLAYCRIGASPDGGSTYTLPRVVGMKWAMELALLGDRFSAERALAMGMVNEVVPEAQLEQATSALAARLIAGPAATLARTKRLLRQSMHSDLTQQLQGEAQCFIEGVAGEEFAEGVRAFAEKRPPLFPGSR